MVCLDYRKTGLITLLLVLLSIPICMTGQVTGKWTTIDENTGAARSIIEIYKKNDAVFGKIIKVLDPAKEGELCDKCKGDEYNQPIIGLEFIKNLQKDGDAYEDGTIFDPETGKQYDAKIWVTNTDNDILNVRGYIGFFYRTQQWLRFKE